MNALLFGDPSPSLRWRAAVELDRASDKDPDVQAWRTEIDAGEEVRGLVAALDAPGAPAYLLCRLAYFGYRGPALTRAVNAIFEQQQPDGSWSVPVPEGPRFVTNQTVVRLRAIAAAGFATDPRAERAYAWLLDARLPDGSWPAGPKADLGTDGRRALPEPEYRRLPQGAGCRSATTGAVAALALHPELRHSDAARVGIDHLLAQESRETSTLGWEVSRLVGLERAMGQVTFYVTFDLAFLLDLASRCGGSLDDPRVHDLVEHLESLRGPFGLWEHPAHPQLSRWLTFDLDSSLARLG